MDRAAEELQFLALRDVLKESISIPKSSPRTFSLITLTLLFPLSFAILAHSLFTHPLLDRIHSHPAASHRVWAHLFLLQLSYLIFLFAFSLLSTAAVVFTVASLYTSKPVSFSSTLAAIPRVLRRLFITFLFVSLLMLLYNLLFLACLLALIVSIDTDSPLLFFLSAVSLLLLFAVVHVYITALWHLASVVSVLEPVYGWAAMVKSRDLLRGKTKMAMIFVAWYLLMCAAVGGTFGALVVRGTQLGVLVRAVLGGFLVGVLVIVNLIGLLVQSVFYYVCKSYHHEGIDKSALYEHLGGYLGEYVPLKSSIQMENLEA